MNATPELLEPASVDMMNGFSQMAPAGELPTAFAPAAAAPLNVIPAQRVPVPRNIRQVMQRLKVLANMRGDAYVYSWSVSDRKNRRQQTIEGPTIKLANDLAREYGNCVVRVRVDETPTHWIIVPQFVDLETGFGYERPFQQRKSQDTGMKDADRQSDLVFQIGVSKAIRNVVINALSTFAEFMVDESRSSLVARFEDAENQKKAHEFIDKVMERHNIAPLQVATVVGRKRENWTVKDLVRVYTEMRGIWDGLTVASEVYPSMEDARIVETEKNKKEAEGKQPPKQAATPPAAEPAKPAADNAAKPAKPAATTTPPVQASEDFEDIPEQFRRTPAKQADAPKPTTAQAAEEPADDATSLFGKEG
jgi:hypothetical protein